MTLVDEEIARWFNGRMSLSALSWCYKPPQIHYMGNRNPTNHEAPISDLYLWSIIQAFIAYLAK